MLGVMTSPDGLLSMSMGMPAGMLLVGAILPLFLLKWLSPTTAWVIFGVMVNAGLAMVGVAVYSDGMDSFSLSGLVCAGLAAIWAVCRGGLRVFGAKSSAGRLRYLDQTARMSSLTMSILAGVVLCVMIGGAVVTAIIETLERVPTADEGGRSLGTVAYVMVLMLAVGCAIRLFVMREMGQVAWIYGLAIAFVFWRAVGGGVLEHVDGGGYVLTDWSLRLLVELTIVHCLFVAGFWGYRINRRWRAAQLDPMTLVSERFDWPGMGTAACVVGVLVMLLVAYQISVPFDAIAWGIRWLAMVTAGCSVAVGMSVFVYAGHRWHSGVAEVGFGLLTLGVATACIVVSPLADVSLRVQFPVMFNAMMFGFAFMTAFWAWVGRVWQQQLDDGQAWTVGGRLIPFTHRYAFFSACLAVGLGSLMAMWPILRSVAVEDDTIGRMSAAVTAHLLLLLVLLWSRRTIGRSSFGGLTLLTLGSMLGFVIVRSQPHVSTTVQGFIWTG